jgi:hypothetical protein
VYLFDGAIDIAALLLLSYAPVYRIGLNCFPLDHLRRS